MSNVQSKKTLTALLNSPLIKKTAKVFKMINAKMLLSFSVGLLTASIVLGIVYLADSDDKPKAAMTEEEMKDKLTEAGYLVYTEEEWNEIVGTPDENEEKAPSEETEAVEEPPEKPEENKEEVRKLTITVTKGMTSIDIGKILEREKFIENAYDFTKAVEQKGVANRLQLGTFEVNSSMTTDEIIATLFK